MRRWAPALVALSVALAAAGCTIGPDEQGSGDARLTVTRDFGARVVLRTAERSLPDGETVMRLLQRRAEVDTRYGGRFVNVINGVSSRSPDGRRRDWFYFVNGIEADKGASEHEVNAGDRVWWDHRDWTTAMRVPAVVGSFPEPFIHGAEGKRFPVRIDCARDAAETCEQVAGRLERAGITPSTTALGVPAGNDLLRFVVGPWSQVRNDGAARLLEQGPRESGVFVDVEEGAGGTRFDVLDRRGSVARSLTRGAGLVAATRFEEQQPAWIVSGTDDTGLQQATRLLSERVLRDRYAVATAGGEIVEVPLPGDAGQAPRDGGGR